MDVLRCDKPYNIDEARKKKGLPRCRRKDSRTTAYELTIRVPSEYQSYFGGKKKLTKVVFALNKKDDLKAQINGFENEKNFELSTKLEEEGKIGAVYQALDASTPLGAYIDNYVELRSHGAVTEATYRHELHFAKYVKAVIASVPIGELAASDIERCILAVPELSEKWALELKAEREAKRGVGYNSRLKRTPKPLGPIKIAGAYTQSAILKFLREVLNDAVDREIIAKNPAKAKFLSKNFKKTKPLIDPLSEEDAAWLQHEIKMLPVGYLKVGLLLLMTNGMRPEEMLAVVSSSFQFGEESSVRIVGAVRRYGEGIEPYVKSDHSFRTAPIDAYTAETVKQWIEIKKEMLHEMGLIPKSNMPLISNHANVGTYEGFTKEWNRFRKKIGFKHVRLYALRHTFATINLARGENIKTISEIMGHSDASYTLDLYVGYVPSTGIGLSNRYMTTLEKTYTANH